MLLVLAWIAATVANAAAAPPSGRVRVETILFVDGAPATSPPKGFRLHLGSSPGHYSSVVDIGMPPAGRTGVRAYTFEVDRGATPYIALSAYDGQGRSSALSNEIERAPRRPAFDHDGRGTSDLLLVDPIRRALKLVRNAGTTTVASGIAAPQGASIAAEGDFDGDGTTDLLWSRQATGELLVWLLAPAGTVRAVALPPAGGLVLRGSGDLDGDGCSDLVFEVPGAGSLSLWFMQGAAVRERAVLAGAPHRWSLVGIGDVDADRRADLVWRHEASGHVEAWLMNGAAVLEQAALAVGKQWETLGLGDYDGDGASDLVLRSRGNDRLASLSILSGALVPLPLAATPAAGSELAVGRDFDGDGFADLTRVDPFRRVAELELLGPTGPGGTLAVDLAQVTLPGDFAREIGDEDNDWNPNYCDGDFDNDGVVGYLDLRRILDCLGMDAIGSCSGLDLDRDGVVGLAELSVVRDNFNAQPCSSQRAP